MLMQPKASARLRLFAILTLLLANPLSISIAHAAIQQQSGAERHQSGADILNRDQAAAILPPSVFFRGQSASIQGRNSAGLKTPQGKLVLAAMVDTSGYSSAIQQTYQAYLLTEVPLNLGGKRLAPGAYGFGFLQGGEMIVMDVGGNEILRTRTTRDDSLPRPNPLQLMRATDGTGFRIYLGRSFVPLAPAEK